MPLPGNAKLLGDAIPAESYARDSNPVPEWGGVGSKSMTAAAAGCDFLR